MVAAVLVLTVAGCADGGSVTTTTDDHRRPTSTEAADVDRGGRRPPTTGTPRARWAPSPPKSVGAEVFADLPLPPGNISGATSRPSFAAWDGGAVFLGPAGGLVRFGPESGAELTPTEGIDTGEEGTTERVVDVLASDDRDAPGHRPPGGVRRRRHPHHQHPGLAIRRRRAPGRPSTPRASSPGTDTVSGHRPHRRPRGRLGGRRRDRRRQPDRPSRSGTPSTACVGRRSDVDGLDHTDTEEDGESIESLAVVDDMMLVVREATGLDDSRLSLLRGTLGEFEELEPTGLDALDLPNSDIIPAVTAVDGQFVLFASVPVEGGDDFGERIPTLFTSPDGETWTATELTAPRCSTRSPCRP